MQPEAAKPEAGAPSTERGDAPVEVLGEIVTRHAEETGQGAGADPEPEEESGGGGYDDGDGLLSREQFAGMLGGVFMITGAAAGLETLHGASRRPQFPGAASAFYDVCRDTPSLRFLIMEDSKSLQQYIAIGMFVMPLGRACIEEIKAKRAKPVNDSAKADAQPEPEADADGEEMPSDITLAAA